MGINKHPKDIFTSNDVNYLAHMMIVWAKFVPTDNPTDAYVYCLTMKFGGNTNKLVKKVCAKLEDGVLLTIFKEDVNVPFRQWLFLIAENEDREWLESIEVSIGLDPFNCSPSLYFYTGADSEAQLPEKYAKTITDLAKNGVDLFSLSVNERFEVISIAAEYSRKCRNNIGTPITETQQTRLVSLIGDSEAEKLLTLIASEMDAKMP